MRCPYCKLHDDTIGPNGYCQHCGRDVHQPLPSELASDGTPNDVHREEFKRQQALHQRRFRNKELIVALALVLFAVAPFAADWATESHRERVGTRALAELPERGQHTVGRVTASTTQIEGRSDRTDFVEYEYVADGATYTGHFTRRPDPRLSDAMPVIEPGETIAVLYHPEVPSAHLRNDADGQPPRRPGQPRPEAPSNGRRMLNLACVLAGGVGLGLLLDALRRSR